MPCEVAGNIGRPLSSLAGAVDDECVRRVRGGRVPARRRRHVSAADRRAPQPRARSPRPLRHLRVVRRHEAPHLRAADRGRHGDRAARLRAGPGRRAQDRVLGRRPASRGAHDPRVCTTARTPQPRPPPRAPPVSRTTRSPPGCGASAESSTGSRTSARSQASATSTTRRRRTPPPLCARSPRFATRRSTSSSAASARTRATRRSPTRSSPTTALI